MCLAEWELDVRVPIGSLPKLLLPCQNAEEAVGFEVGWWGGWVVGWFGVGLGLVGWFRVGSGLVQGWLAVGFGWVWGLG